MTSFEVPLRHSLDGGAYKSAVLEVIEASLSVWAFLLGIYGCPVGRKEGLSHMGIVLSLMNHMGIVFLLMGIV